MSAVLATRPPLHRALWRAIRAAWLRLLIWGLDRYIKQCERDGIYSTKSMAEFRAQLEGHRCELAIVEQSA